MNSGGNPTLRRLAFFTAFLAALPIASEDEDSKEVQPFSFCTLAYTSARSEAQGIGWGTDYPDAGLAFMKQLAAETGVPIKRDARGNPEQTILDIPRENSLPNVRKPISTEGLFTIDTIDPKVHPYIFMSDAGTAEFTDEEVAALRSYLLGGGLLHVDDFWGDRAWNYWEYQIGRVFHPDDFPIVDIDLDHPIFHHPYFLKELPQVPSVQFWERSGAGETSERGLESATPHYRGIFDTDGRIMVFMSFNTDLGDGWQAADIPESELNPTLNQYRDRFSGPALELGFNLVIYAREQVAKR